MRTRLNVYFPPALAKQVDELAIRRRISRSAIVEAAVASYLSPDGADRMEAAFARRLDRLSRQVQRLERNTGLTTEALTLFVRFWLSVTPQLPDDEQAAAQVKGRKRYKGFVETLGRRYASGKSLMNEIPEDVWLKHPASHSDNWIVISKSRDDAFAPTRPESRQRAAPG